MLVIGILNTQYVQLYDNSSFIYEMARVLVRHGNILQKSHNFLVVAVLVETESGREQC